MQTQTQNRHARAPFHGASQWKQPNWFAQIHPGYCVSIYAETHAPLIWSDLILSRDMWFWLCIRRSYFLKILNISTLRCLSVLSGSLVINCVPENCERKPWLTNGTAFGPHMPVNHTRQQFSHNFQKLFFDWATHRAGCVSVRHVRRKGCFGSDQGRSDGPAISAPPFLNRQGSYPPISNRQAVQLSSKSAAHKHTRPILAPKVRDRRKTTTCATLITTAASVADSDGSVWRHEGAREEEQTYDIFPDLTQAALFCFFFISLKFAFCNLRGIACVRKNDFYKTNKRFCFFFCRFLLQVRDTEIAGPLQRILWFMGLSLKYSVW